MGFGFNDVNEEPLEDLANAYQWSLEECGSCANHDISDCYFRNEGIPGKCEHFDLKGFNSLSELLVARVD